MFTPVAGVQLVIQNLQVDMYAFVDAACAGAAAAAAAASAGAAAAAADRTAWSFADLAFRLEMTGTINLFQTDGVPHLGAAAASNLEVRLCK